MNAANMMMMMTIQKKIIVLMLHRIQERWILGTKLGPWRRNSALKREKGISYQILNYNF